jgi:hypothetical protein
MHVQEFFERMKGPVDKGNHRRLVAETFRKLARMYIVALFEMLPHSAKKVRLSQVANKVYLVQESPARSFSYVS